MRDPQRDVGQIGEVMALMDVAERFEPRGLRYGPGIPIPFTGEPPKFTRDPQGEVWRCDGCGVTVPAGVMPFPHQGCSPGRIVRVLGPVDLALEEMTWEWPAA
jgi:hypothetical protein